MAGISLGMGFDLQAQSYLDIRQSFETLATMKSFPETERVTFTVSISHTKTKNRSSIR